MSAVTFLKCDRCDRISELSSGRPEDLRRLLREKDPGWTSGYIQKPYSGKRADFCPKCSRKAVSK